MEFRDLIFISFIVSFCVMINTAIEYLKARKLRKEQELTTKIWSMVQSAVSQQLKRKK